jgi:membrane protease YdiL (CAAX protease family)
VGRTCNGRLRETRFGDALAIPLGAIVWALSHDYVAWQGLAALFLQGCVLGAMWRGCRSILPGCCVHAFNNIAAIAIEIVQGFSAG